MEARKVKIEKIVSGGYGLGRVDGRVILVPFSIPGEEALVEIAQARKGVAWGSIKQILSSSPSRIRPFCDHFTRCGGCQLQHIAYEDQLEYKRLIVDDVLRRLGGLQGADVGSCIASPAHMGYRSRVRLHCRGRKICFHEFRSKRIVPLECCPVVSDKINACLNQLSSYISRHPIRGLSEIQITEDTGSRIVLTLEMDSMPGVGLIEELQDNVEVSGAAVRVGHHRDCLWGETHSTVSVEGRIFRISPGSFFQANLSLAPTLIRQVLEAVKSNDIDMGVELYGGVGVFSIMLSEKAKRLVAVEWNRDAAGDAVSNLKANRIGNVDVISISVEDAMDLLFSRGIKPELVLVDPPREGLSTIAREKLIRMSPRQLLYVSCDPATLARDIKSILASGGYRLEKVTPLDMFPHTSHIECVCSLIKG